MVHRILYALYFYDMLQRKWSFELGDMNSARVSLYVELPLSASRITERESRAFLIDMFKIEFCVSRTIVGMIYF